MSWDRRTPRSLVTLAVVVVLTMTIPTIGIAASDPIVADRVMARTTSVYASPKVAPDTASTQATGTTDVVSGIYGSAVAIDAKNNYQVGWTSGQKVSHRFRAGTSASLIKIAFNQRGGSGYSAGTGGVMNVSIRTDDAGRPSGTVLSSLTFAPGNPNGGWERQNALTFTSPAHLNKGQRYHVVFANVDDSPSRNYISVNEAYQYLATSPRQPAFTDDFAVLTNHGNGWKVMAKDTPVMDLTYDDGHHDGNAYGGIVPDYVSSISGAGKMVRERFTVRGADRTIRSATFRVKRIHGIKPLRFRLAKVGTAIRRSGKASASKVPVSDLPKEIGGGKWVASSLAGGRWVTVRFNHSIVLRSGATYDLRLSTTGHTRYVAIPLREQDGVGALWKSRAFRDGSAQRKVDRTGWHLVYAWADFDFQFYLR